MQNIQLDALFAYLIQDMEPKKKATLEEMYFNFNRLEDQQRIFMMKDLEERITEKVMQNVHVRIEKEAMKELEKSMKKIFR